MTGINPEKYQLLPELPAEQFEALKADIAAQGVLVAVVVDEYGAILDGHNRVRACRELGINDYPVEVRRGLTEPQKRALARNLNALRRHLTRDQVRTLIADQLRDTPEWSNRRIAGSLGVDDKTVASVRVGLVATAEFPQLDKTVGADGKARRAPPKRGRKYSVDPDEDWEDDDEALERINADIGDRKANKEFKEAITSVFGRAHPKGLDGLSDEDKLALFNARVPLETVVVMSGPSPRDYDPLEGRTDEQKRECYAFVLFLVRRCRFSLEGASNHTEWILRTGDAPSEISTWMGDEGDAWRKWHGYKPISQKTKKSWEAFAAEHASKPLSDLTAELEKIAAA
jgi:ParB-like chromosome segregation protein Spo0J